MGADDGRGTARPRQCRCRLRCRSRKSGRRRRFSQGDGWRRVGSRRGQLGRRSGASGSESPTSRRAITNRWWKTTAAASLCTAGFRQRGLVRGRPIRGSCKVESGSASRPRARPAAAVRRLPTTANAGAWCCSAASARRPDRISRRRSSTTPGSGTVNAGANKRQRVVRADDTPTGWCSMSARASCCSMVAPRRIAMRPLSDMWQWDGERWTEIRMTGPTPGHRYQPVMVYDRARDRTVLYGGIGGPGDTWEWDGQRWRQAGS